MAEAARVFSFRRRAESEQESEKRALKEGLAQTRTLISHCLLYTSDAADEL